jgi:hypothetical protein
MKANMLSILAALLLIGGGFAACDEPKVTRAEDPQEEPKDPPKEEPQDPPKEEPQDLPKEEPQEGVDVPFTLYSLIGEFSDPRTALNWINLEDDESDYNGKILVINSDEEMKKYISGAYPPIDFSKKTLLLAYGHESHLNSPEEVKLQKNSKHDYVMTINLRFSYATAELDWRVAIVVDKLNEENDVLLNITKSNETEIKKATGTIIGSYFNGFGSILVQVDSEYPVGKSLEFYKMVNQASYGAYSKLTMPESGTYPNLIQVQYDLDFHGFSLPQMIHRRIEFSYRPFQRDKDLELFTIGIGIAQNDVAPPQVPIFVVTDYRILND